MEKYTVKRDGEKDLRFTGEIIGESSSRWITGKEQNRWTEVRIYLTTSGKFVIEEAYYTQWQGEVGSSQAAICETVEALHGEMLALDEEELGFLSDVHKEALEEAIKHVPELEAALYEEI